MQRNITTQHSQKSYSHSQQYHNCQMVKLVNIPSLLIVAIALVVGARLSRPRKRWHEGKEWQNFFQIYDDYASKYYSNCNSRLLPTKFGDTHVFLCGSPENPPALLFHGINTNALMFANWIVPKLAESHYVVAIDTLCDMGKSCPADGDLANCPPTPEAVAEWTSELMRQLNITKASLVGFSFGCFLASCVAMNTPELVDKLVFMAPAGVFAPIELAWVARAIAVGIVGSVLGWESVYAERVRTNFVSYMTTSDPKTAFQNPELLRASERAGTAQVAVRPVAYSVEELREVNTRHPTLLIIGEKEKVIDPDVAIETAKQAGIKTKVYSNASHILFSEHPRDDIVDVVASFLND